MVPAAVGVDDLMQQLKVDRLIKIFIGDETEPYLIPESTLVNASDYFAKAIKYELTMGEDKELGTLRFPGDGYFKEAWELLLYWIINKSLNLSRTDAEVTVLSTEDQLLSMKAWILGDKYLIPQLQDAVMMRLMQHTENTILRLDCDMLTAMLRLSPVGTPLRRLLAEETVYRIYGYLGETDLHFRLTEDDLIASDGTTGLIGSFLIAHRDFRHNGSRIRRLKDEDKRDIQKWKEYMVSEADE